MIAESSPAVWRMDTRWLLGLIVLRIVLLGWYASHLPLLEKYDEANHYDVAHFIARAGRLPQVGDAPNVADHLRIYQQYDQPPLTYLLLAPIVRLFDGSSALLVQPAGASFCDSPPATFYIHPQQPTSELEANWRGIRAARFVIMSLTTLALPFIWWAGRIVTPESRHLALLASVTYCLLPVLLDVSVWVNNDALLLLLGAMALVPTARHARRIATWRDDLALLVLSIGALLTKLTGLPLVLVAALLVLRRRPQLRWRLLGLLLIGLVLVGALNLSQCGLPLCRLHRFALPISDFTALPASLRFFLPGLTEMIQHWLVPAPRLLPDASVALYGLSAALYSSVFVGSVLALMRRDPIAQQLAVWCLLLLGAALGLALLRIWWLQVSFFKPRYLSVALPAVCLLIGLGLRWWLLRWRWVVVMWVLSLLAVAMVMPIGSHRPLWQSVERLSQLPESAISIAPLRFENGLRVEAYEWDADSIWLYMRPERPIEQAAFALLTTHRTDGERLAVCGQLAGTGLWNAPDWQPDEWVRQRFALNTAGAAAFSLALYPLQALPPPETYFDAERPITRIAGDDVRLIVRP